MNNEEFEKNAIAAETEEINVVDIDADIDVTG